jgi:pimeloyl-ACP methyl ester carboxylesterase
MVVTDVEDDVWRDKELEEKFHKINGPSNETSLQFIWRTYQGLCDRICRPERKPYSSADVETRTENILLKHNLEKSCKFQIQNNKFILSSSIEDKVQSIYWKNLNLGDSYESNCIIYLHTNTRNLLDAVDFLPLCHKLNTHLLAFDLPGHGLTQTRKDMMSTSLSLEALNHIIHWLITKQSINKIILIGRGMSTAICIEYCAYDNNTQKFNSHFNNVKQVRSFFRQSVERNVSQIDNPTSYQGHKVCAIILDSPYTSIGSMVDDAVVRFQNSGHYLPTFLFNVGARMIRSSVTNRLGFDPYSIKPVTSVPKITQPILIVAASNDDYIPIHHAFTMQSSCTCSSRCELIEFEGTHFSDRPNQIYDNVEIFLRSLGENPL